MIFSRSAQYAIQALVLMATRPAGSYVMSKELAERLQLPPAYLSKLMLQFSRAGILESARGRQGGYRLHCNPHVLSLKEVLVIVCGERSLQECMLGLKECSDATACAMHGSWRPVKQKLFSLLDEQSIGKLADAVLSGRCRLGDLNVARLLPSA